MKYTMARFFLFMLLALASCRPVVLDAIQPECFNAEQAEFYVNDNLQNPKEGSFGGSSLYYLFGAKMNGEWSLNIESEDYELAISAAELLPFSAMLSLTEAEKIDFMAKNGTYTITHESKQIQNLLFSDFKKSELLEIRDVVDGEVHINLINTALCSFVTVDFRIKFSKNNEQWNVTGNVKSAYANAQNNN